MVSIFLIVACLFQVIFNIGEIDCREGILVAIDRDRYASLEQGMTETIKIFVAVLNELI